MPKGQRVYDILPSPNASGSALAGSGQVPLDGPPVVPGSARSQALIGVVTPTGNTPRNPPATSAGHGDGGGDAAGISSAPPEPHSYWGRVVRSLEFWS